LSKLRTAATILLGLALIAILSTPLCSAADRNQADQAISKGEQDLGAAYVSVAEAEEVGVDTSRLEDTLNVAASHLAEAHLALDLDNFDDAVLLADQCSSASLGVSSDAKRLKAEAGTGSQVDLLGAATFSFYGIVVLVIIGLLGWYLLKRRYVRRLLRMKIETKETTE